MDVDHYKQISVQKRLLFEQNKTQAEHLAGYIFERLQKQGIITDGDPNSLLKSLNEICEEFNRRVILFVVISKGRNGDMPPIWEAFGHAVEEKHDLLPDAVRKFL